MQAKLLALIATVALAGSFLNNIQTESSELLQGFERFQAKFGKVYATEQEEAFRFAVWASNIAKINAHNAAGKSYTMAENHFADLTQEEFAATFLGYKPREITNVVDETPAVGLGNVDWRTEGAVQVVKDQGQCGSCWAFSAMGSSESASFLLHGNELENFAEQQLVDCDRNDSGCNGGWMDNAFSYLEGAGTCLTSSYRYTARGGSCKADSCDKSSFTVSGYKDCQGVSSMTSCLQQQPVAVAVDANNWSFYSGGIFDDCGSSLDHGVLLVANDETSWTIKNSWGTYWGEEGFIRLKTGNTCGVANSPSVPH